MSKPSTHSFAAKNFTSHVVGNQTRVTVVADCHASGRTFDKLVAIAVGNQYVWICSGFTA